MTITLTVAERIAAVTTDSRPVGGNQYPFTLALDGEWTGSLYLRVRFADQFYDIPFVSTDTTVMVQFPIGFPEVGIGIYSEALQICTSEARVRLRPSILEQGGSPVEFDSTLYEQWAGEVSELLCDDAFDSTSPRPIKNSVLTAWKDTLPPDSSLVHRTGEETIAGTKTFTSILTVKRNSPALALKSQYPSTSLNTYKGQISVTDLKDGAESNILLAIEQTKSDCEELMVRHYKPDRSGYHSLYLRSYSDHHLAFGVPYYPVDGSGNPQAMPTNTVMLSGNIAVDPRIVHTTGNEVISGTKTFNNPIVAYPGGWHTTGNNSAMEIGQYCIFARITPSDNAMMHVIDFIQGTNTMPCYGRLMFKDFTNNPDPAWIYRSPEGKVNNPLSRTCIVLLSDGTYLYLAWKREVQYGYLRAREVVKMRYGSIYAPGDSIEWFAVADMPKLSDLSGYTVFEVQDSVVHTTGTETVAGEKTFTDALTSQSASTAVLNLASTANSSSATTRGRISILSNGSERGRVFQYRASNAEQMGIRQYRMDTSGSFDLVLTATEDGRGYVTVPTYTADNNADTKVVNRAMLASTPTVVHTTGAETIAGTKTFTSPIEANSAFRRIRFSKTIYAGKWYCLYAMPRAGGGNTALIRVCEANNLLTNHVELAIRIGYGPGYHVAGSMTGVASAMSIAVVRRASDGYLEVWASSTGNGQFITDVLTWRISPPTVQSGESDTKPVIGDVYDELVDVEMAS